MTTSDKRYLIIPFFAVLSGLAGCGTVSQVNPMGTALPPRNEDCKVAVFTKTAMPDRYDTIGQIETHIKRNVFFGGNVTTADEGIKELSEKTCALGGNGVVIDTSIETASAEMRHVHIWARALNVMK